MALQQKIKSMNTIIKCFNCDNVISYWSRKIYCCTASRQYCKNCCWIKCAVCGKFPQQQKLQQRCYLCYRYYDDVNELFLEQSCNQFFCILCISKQKILNPNNKITYPCGHEQNNQNKLSKIQSLIKNKSCKFCQHQIYENYDYQLTNNQKCCSICFPNKKNLISQLFYRCMACNDILRTKDTDDNGILVCQNCKILNQVHEQKKYNNADYAPINKYNGKFQNIYIPQNLNNYKLTIKNLQNQRQLEVQRLNELKRVKQDFQEKLRKQNLQNQLSAAHIEFLHQKLNTIKNKTDKLNNKTDKLNNYINQATQTKKMLQLQNNQLKQASNKIKQQIGWKANQIDEFDKKSVQSNGQQKAIQSIQQKYSNQYNRYRQQKNNIRREYASNERNRNPIQYQIRNLRPDSSNKYDKYSKYDKYNKYNGYQNNWHNNNYMIGNYVPIATPPKNYMYEKNIKYDEPLIPCINNVNPQVSSKNNSTNINKNRLQNVFKQKQKIQTNPQKTKYKPQPGNFQKSKIFPNDKKKNNDINNSHYNEKQCKICLYQMSCMINQVCRHMIMCETCLNQIKRKQNKQDIPCPICLQIGLYHKYLQPILH